MNGYTPPIASAYSRHRRTHPELLRSLVVRGQLSPESCILELGCGTGNYLQALVELTGGTCYGVDPSEAMLHEARRRPFPTNCVCAPAEQTGLPAQHFDLLFAVDVVHHLRDRAKAFREVRRMLRPGGRFCLATDSPEILRTREPLSNFFPETVPVELARYPGPETLRAELQSAGFALVSEEQVEFRGALEDIHPYSERTFSCLRLISEEAFQHGLARLERALADGPVSLVSRYLLLWAE